MTQVRLAVMSLVLIAFATTVRGGVVPPPASAPSSLLTPTQLRQDLDVLRQTFERAHARLYRYTSRVVMDSAFDAVAAGLTQPLGVIAFYRRLAPLVDLVHDSHTPLILPRPVRWDFAKRAGVFPLVIRYVGERAFVERNASANRDIPLRGEVMAINDRPMSEITPQVLLGRSTDGFVRGAKYHAQFRDFWFCYRALVDTLETYRIQIRDPGTGEIRLYVAKGVPSDSLVRGRFTTAWHDTFALDFIANGRVGLMSIPTLADTALRGKFRDAFAEIRRRHLPDLVIDLRDDGGGIDEFNTALLDHLVDHPYRFYSGFTYVARDTMALRFTTYRPEDFMGDTDRKRQTPEEWVRSNWPRPLPQLLDHVNETNLAAGVHGPEKEGAFAGHLYVLVNGGSASSAAEIPALLHALGVGTLVGEEPNGAYQGVTAGILLDLTLPNSGIRTRVPLIAYHNAVQPGDLEGRGAPPDFEVVEAVEDAIAGRDTALEFTLKLIREHRGR